MTYQEKHVTAYLISLLVGAGFYTVYLLQQIDADKFDSNTISSDWGFRVLLAIGVTIGATILMTIIMTLVQTIITQEDPITVTDERDQLIALQTDRIAFTVFGIGFVIAMLTLATGMTPLVMFNLIIYALFGASIVGTATKLYLYRRGF